MDAGTHTLSVIFGQDRRHVVPLYQRPYVWNEQGQWAPLWDDLRTMADRALGGQPVRPHFMGAIVLDQVDVPYGTIDTRWIIDGQQRLTTIQLLLEAVSDSCQAMGLEKHDRAARKLTRNDDPLSTEDDHVFKVWPTNADQAHFRRAMLAGTPEEILAQYKVKPGAKCVGQPIVDAYLYFYRQVHGWLGESSAAKDRADALLNILRESIRMVVIDLKEGDDAQVIFETLNARGTPLLPSDLIKNNLFITAAREKLDRAKLYGKYWQPFDDNPDYWRADLGKGLNKRARIDIFFQHFLVLKSRDEVPVTHLYSVFKDYVAHAPSKVEEHFAQIRRYAQVYESFDSASAASVEGRFLRRVAALDNTTVYPLLLELFSRLEPGSMALQKCLSVLESFLVRRAICQLTTRAYNRFFIEILGQLDGPAEGIEGRLEAALAKGQADHNLWPSDAEVHQAMAERPIYRTLVRSRLNMILDALNSSLQTGKSEQLIAESLTIEHLMPQSWKEHWAIPAGPDSEARAARRDILLHTIGNLTLLTKRLNPSVSNGSWSTKCKEILAHSALNLNRDLPAAWDESSIQARSKLLANVACNAWSAPASVRDAGLRNVATVAKGDDDVEAPESPDGEEKLPGARQQALYRFWQGLIDRSKARTALLANRSTTTDQWISAPVGRSGFWFNLTLTQEVARIDVYMRLKNAQDFQNKAIFAALREQKDAIEAAFGGELQWQELPGRIGSRICTEIPGSWALPEEEWPALQDKMINCLIRLDNAVRGPIHQLDVNALLTESASA